MKKIDLPLTLGERWAKFQAQQKTAPGTGNQTQFKLSCDYTVAKSYLESFYTMNVELSGQVLKLSDELREDVNWVSRWVTSSTAKPSLLIRGDNGNGKTTLANSLCDVIESVGRIGVMRVEGHEFSDMFAIGVTEDARQKNNDRMNQMMNTRLLLIDDMGKDEPEYRNWGTIHRPLERILISRYERGKQTVLTTNLNDEEIRARYGNHVLDRLRERYNKLVITRHSYR